MSASLRVLFVGLRWPPETIILRLIAEQAQRGVRVTVATRQRQAGTESARVAGPALPGGSAPPPVRA